MSSLLVSLDAPPVDVFGCFVIHIPIPIQWNQPVKVEESRMERFWRERFRTFSLSSGKWFWQHAMKHCSCHQTVRRRGEGDQMKGRSHMLRTGKMKFFNGGRSSSILSIHCSSFSTCPPLNEVMAGRNTIGMSLHRHS